MAIIKTITENETGLIYCYHRVTSAVVEENDDMYAYIASCTNKQRHDSGANNYRLFVGPSAGGAVTATSTSAGNPGSNGFQPIPKLLYFYGGIGGSSGGGTLGNGAQGGAGSYGRTGGGGAITAFTSGAGGKGGPGLAIVTC
jgi:hypothetical protein